MVRGGNSQSQLNVILYKSISLNFLKIEVIGRVICIANFDPIKPNCYWIVYWFTKPKRTRFYVLPNALIQTMSDMPQTNIFKILLAVNLHESLALLKIFTV